mgnify:CR=1 FL=1
MTFTLGSIPRCRRVRASARMRNGRATVDAPLSLDDALLAVGFADLAAFAAWVAEAAPEQLDSI